ncbi:MAG TPA: trypsin-like peptidase domain-containing protein [Planctomycetota bacterium]|nr:trypsin-like peptidase domain-containing protein [Planctomycetota bacterium]
MTLAPVLSLVLALAQEKPDAEKIQDLQTKLHDVVEKVKPAYVFFGNGSGVCISSDGYALTNFHVSGDRQGQRVRMLGGRQFLADIVGFDPLGDISLCKLRNAKDLPFCELGDSDALEMGQHVIAVGNPFLLGNGSWEPTITFGIISALHRYMDNPGYFDAIQTDAQINPGNSGGPLITLDGKVVGINGRIDIRRFMNRVNTGIGYAIPSRQIQRYMDAFKHGGRVFEGFIDGVQIGECGDSRYDSVGEYGDGVFVARVDAELPAAKAGFEPGDIIFDVEGYRISNANRFHGVVSNWPEGATVRVKVRRKAEEKELKVFLGDPAKILERKRAMDALDLGFTVNANMVVGPVAAGSAGAKAGLKPGDVLARVDEHRVGSWTEVRALLRPGAEMTLTVSRDGTDLELPLKVPRPKSDE